MSLLSPRSEALVNLWLVSERLSAKADHRIGAVHGIGYVEFVVLLQLSRAPAGPRAPAGRMRRVDLAAAIGRTASGVTRLLKPMEKIGLVSRDSSARDARVSLVALTEAGNTRLNEALETFDDVARRSLQPLGDATLDSMRAGLALLREV